MIPDAKGKGAPRRPFGRRLARAAGVAVLVAVGLGGLAVVARTAVVEMVIRNALASRALSFRIRDHGQSLARNSPRGNRPQRLKI